MIEKINLLRNIGEFDSVTFPNNITLTQFSLIYAENARGKTTLSAILHSLTTGIAQFINERHRLGSQNPPHIVITHRGQQVVFQNGTWSYTIPDIAIYDDAFVAANICSGINLETSHRQNLHELILGAQGVALNTKLQEYVDRNEQHILELRNKDNAIPASARGPFSVDAFCDLKPDPDIDINIKDMEHRLAAANSADSIRKQAEFVPITLPDIDVNSINVILSQTLADLEAEAATRVRSHLDSLGNGGEAWVADGMSRISSASKGYNFKICPFCSQNLDDSELINLYQAYFSKEYKTLTTSIQQIIFDVRNVHNRDISVKFERSISTAVQNREFWKNFIDLPDILVDTTAISHEWTAARESILGHLKAKELSPLESMALTEDNIVVIAKYRERREEIAMLSANLQTYNERLNIIKEQAATDNLVELESTLKKLKAKKQRFDPTITPLCDAFLEEKANKKQTETLRDQTRASLDQYRQQIFPAYETAINENLAQLNASFRLGSVKPINTRAGSSASYFVVINQTNVDISAENGPSFRNTLSSGDRNTLALAFFFASIELDPNLEKKIVILDDPMTSLDEHRTEATIEKLKTLGKYVKQVIVLSHRKSFLCALWEGLGSNDRASMRILRAGIGSKLSEWEVRNDSFTDHDKRYELVNDYIQANNPKTERNVAEALRPILESFIRVAYPLSFHPSNTLGPFISECKQQQGTKNEILSSHDITELETLLNYANRFHHDTNPAYKTTSINDTELVNFAKRTFSFTSR